MTRKSLMMFSLGVLSIFVTSPGCAMLTTERVATFVATQVGKKAVKDLKEKHDQEKAVEEQQQQASAP